MKRGVERGRILCAAEDPTVFADTVGRLEDGLDADADLLKRVSAVAATLDEETVVACVVTDAHLADGDWRDLVEAVRDRDPDLPVVLHPPEHEASMVTDPAHDGVSMYLPRSDADGTDLSERVGAAIERSERLRRLRERDERYETIMAKLPLTLFFKDEEARYVAASDWLVDSLEVDPIGKTDAELWGDGEGAGVETYRDDLEVIETCDPVVGKVEHVVEGTEEMWVRSSKFPWYDESGEVRGLVGISRPITEQKVQERELRRQSQRLEQFARFISHDLRNPINIAQGYLDRARENRDETGDDTGDESALEEVGESLEQMEALVEDLLTTVRPGEVRTDWIEFADFLDRVWTGTDTGDASVRIDVPEDLAIAAVSGQLRQLLVNLFRNADEHGGRGVTVTVGVTDAGFSVEDDGDGFDHDDYAEMFEYDRPESGSGTGLAIVHEIATSHGWDVTVAESESGGARFEFDDCITRRREYVTVTAGQPLALDASTDVGDVEVSGQHERPGAGDRWALTAAGGNLWGNVDEHYFVYATTTGNARIEARVTDVEEVHEFSKAGVMVRDAAASGSALAYVGATPGHGTETVHRSAAGDPVGSTQLDLDHEVPRWYRLDWIDGTATLASSADREEWRMHDRLVVRAEEPVHLGLAVCSHVTPRTCRAVFEDVRAVELEPGESDR